MPDSVPDIYGVPGTAELLAMPCPGCGLEPEVVQWWSDTKTKRRKGYTCTCGFRVIDGIVTMTGDRF